MKSSSRTRTARITTNSLLVALVFAIAAADPSSSSSQQLTPEGAKALLDCHNGYRALAARGKAVNKDGSRLPGSDCMYAMVRRTKRTQHPHSSHMGGRGYHGSWVFKSQKKIKLNKIYIMYII